MKGNNKVLFSACDNIVKVEPLERALRMENVGFEVTSIGDTEQKLYSLRF